MNGHRPGDRDDQRPPRDNRRPPNSPKRAGPPQPARRSGGLFPSSVRGPAPAQRPPLTLQTTTLWEYPSQHYGEARAMQGDQAYIGATPSWVIWQLLQRYTKPGDLVLDPMCGSGTTIDVARDVDRRSIGYDLNPTRADIFKADARQLPIEDAKADFVFTDPPYSTHVNYSDDPRCIGKLDASGGEREDGGQAYYGAMERVIGEMHRVLKPGRFAALYVSDSYKKKRGKDGSDGTFMPIGFTLFGLLSRVFRPVDIISVVRHNQKLGQGNWRAAAEEGNFYLRGFNYLFVMKKDEQGGESGPRGAAKSTKSPSTPRYS